MTVVTGGPVDRRSARIGIALYAAWLAAAVILGLWRPGELLEVAAVGAAGLVAFAAVARSSPTAQVWVVAGACFAAPLLGTWPGGALTCAAISSPNMTSSRTTPQQARSSPIATKPLPAWAAVSAAA